MYTCLFPGLILWVAVPPDFTVVTPAAERGIGVEPAPVPMATRQQDENGVADSSVPCRA